MSAEAQGYVYRHSPFEGAVFDVHLAVADSVNDQHGNEFWMTLERLALKCRRRRPTVSKAMATLEAEGFVEVVGERAKGKHATRYRFLFPDVPVVFDSRAIVTSGNGSGANRHGSARSTVTGDDGQPSADVTQNPKGNPSEDPKLAEARRLCGLLADRVAQHSGKRPKVTEGWVTEMDRLLRLGCPEWDKPEVVSAEKVERMVAFIFDHADPDPKGFCWADQIRSAPTLRRQWEKLRVWANGLVRRQRPGSNGSAPADEGAPSDGADWMVRQPRRSTGG